MKKKNLENKRITLKWKKKNLKNKRITLKW
jgi:hypothetical protein